MKNPRALSLAPVICAIPLLGWWMYGLFDLDEGFYAAVVAEMNRKGEWITPLYNGKPWFEKPILLYWLAKPTLAVFGGEFGVRMPSILACLATYGLIAWFGKRRLGPSSGIVAALVLATSLFFVAVGRMVLVDPILITCLTGAFLTFWESLVGDRRWRLASAALLGLAVLAKGPVACVLFVAVIAYTFWRERELRAAFGGASGWVFGTLIFAGVVAAWYVPAYHANHQVFVEEFLIKQNLQRFKGGDEAHAVPMPVGLIYYVPVVLIGMIPWSLLVPRAWPRRNDQAPDAPVRRYLATWAVAVFAFFTVSGTKLPHYVLPCFVPLALLVGHDLAVRWQELTERRVAAIGVGAIGLCALLTLGFRAYYQASQIDGPVISQEIREGLGPDEIQSKGHETERIILFRLSRQPAGLYPPVPDPRLFGRIPIRINQTSTPSLLFYVDPEFEAPSKADYSSRGLFLTPPAIESDDLLDVRRSAEFEWIVTRPGRLTQSDQAVLRGDGLSVTELNPTHDPLFTVFKIAKAGTD